MENYYKVLQDQYTARQMFEAALLNCLGLKDLLLTQDGSVEFYSAMINMQWARNQELTEDGLFEFLEKGPITVSYSWRGAGALIADLRRTFYGVDTSYMDYYGSGSPQLSERIVNILGTIGWKPQPYNF